VITADEARQLRDRGRRDPAWWVRTLFPGDLEPYQVRILESVRDNVRTAVRACHAPGKTWVASRAVLWFLLCHPGSIVVTTAPTWRQVEQLLWAEIRAAYNVARLPLGGCLYKTPQKGLVVDSQDKWFAVGVSTTESEKFQGYHAPHVLIVVDESSGVPDNIFEGIRGVLSAGFVRLLLLGNPTRPEGEFYDAFNSKAAVYGGRIHISAWDTPNLAPLKDAHDACPTRAEKVSLLRGAPIEVPHLVSPAWVADMLEEFGEESPIFRVRVLGEFPPSAPDQLIPLHLVEASSARWAEETTMHWWRQPTWTGQSTLGADIARYGDAETVFASLWEGMVAPLEVYQQQDTMATTGRLVAAQRRYRAGITRVDAVGLGAGVYDRGREVGIPGLVAVNVGQSSSKPKEFVNIRAEWFWHLRNLFETGAIAVPLDHRLHGQLSSLRYRMVSGGQMQVETKEEARKRGVVSPDRADAVMLAAAPGSFGMRFGKRPRGL
jgi:phage terminase large subunit